MSLKQPNLELKSEGRQVGLTGQASNIVSHKPQQSLMVFRLEQKQIPVCGYLRTRVWVQALLLVVVGLGGIPRTMAQSDEASRRRGSFRKVEPSLYAPELYADRLRPIFSLVNLPGADSPASYMEASYQVYFVAEAAFNNTMKRVLSEGGQITSPTQFNDKILLGEGRFKLKRLANIDDRTHTGSPIDFKSKVSDNLRTKFATVLITFAVKIYDAKLKTPFYRSSFFMTQPFDDDPANPGRAIPREVLYTNFFITAHGDLFTSQWRRTPGDTTWHP